MASRLTSRSGPRTRGRSSFQRSITRDMAIEARYVGTYGMDQWSELNYNSVRGENLVKTGFINEFRLAMENLKNNNASGDASRLGSFAYFGPNTGTNPLPIYLAYLNASRDANNPAVYRGTNNAASTNHDLVEHHVCRPAGAGESQSGKCRRRSGRQQRPRRQCGRRRSAAELLHSQPGDRRRQRHRQRGLQRLPRAADRTETPPVERAVGEHQLSVRDRARLGLRRLQLRPQHERPGQRPSRLQDAVGLDGSGRPRPAVRVEPESGARCALSAAGR